MKIKFNCFDTIENKQSAMRDHFSLVEIAIFHQVAPIKNSLNIILCARSAENFVPLQTLFSYLKIAIF